VTQLRGHRLGQGKLSASRVARDALGMLRQGFRRVVIVAAIVFAVPAVLTAALEYTAASAPPLAGIAVPIAVVAFGTATVLRLFGPVLYAGFLDEAVGKEYLFGEHETFTDVLRNLPWLRLAAADLIVLIGTSIGLALFIVPGIAFYALFGLVGPVIVQERLTLLDAFRRTFRLTRTAIPVVLALVVVPVAAEHALHELALAALHDAGLGVRVLAEWLVAVVVGATIGLLEVALAAELIARNPR